MKNILAITYWSFKEPLIQSGALPYLKIISDILPKGSRIFLFTLEKKNYPISKEEENTIIKELANYNIILIKRPYYSFGILPVLALPLYLIQLYTLCISNKIQYIHCWCTPAGVLGYILSLLTGKKLIIDSYEPHAETMVETGNWKKSSLAFKLLFLFEKLQSKKAFSVIALSAGMKEYARTKYNTALDQYHIRSTCVDLDLFREPTESKKILRSQLEIADDSIICIYTGKIGGIYLDDEIFEFISSAVAFWGERFKMLLLTDTPKTKLSEYLSKHFIKESQLISLFASHTEVKNYLAMADFAICPVKPIYTKRFCSPIKTGEYWAMSLPVVIPGNIGDDSDIIEKNDIGAILPALNKREYENAVRKIDRLIHNPDILSLKKKIRAIAHQYRDFNSTRKIYRDIYI